MAEQQSQKPSTASKAASTIGNVAVDKGMRIAATRLAATTVGAGVGRLVLEAGLLVKKGIRRIGQAVGLVGKNTQETLGRAMAFSGALMASALLSVGIAVGAAIVIGIPVVALIMFIINTGAYVAPYETIGGGAYVPSNSQYINVTKVASPAGPFQNSALPLTINYTITISATTEILTDISFTDNCIVTKTGETLSCPTFNPAIPQAPEQLAPGETFTINYSAEFSGSYTDSITINSLIVTATAGANPGQRSTGTASIIIGNPPTECFVFEGWPEQERLLQTQAIAQMAVAQSFMARLCAGGPITLIYSTADTGYGGFHHGNRRVTIYPRGRGSLPNRFYTLTHEIGHVFGAAYNNILFQYRDDASVRSEAPICTYPLPAQPWFEDFAEMIALYFSQNPVSTYRDFRCLNGQTFPEVYPRHWQWARDNIILDDLSW